LGHHPRRRGERHPPCDHTQLSGRLCEPAP